MSSVPGWANVNERRNLPPALAVSTVILGIREGEDGGPDKLCLPLVRRIRQPHAGMWALPGGPVEPRESLGQAASRNLAKPRACVRATWSSFIPSGISTARQPTGWSPSHTLRC